MALLPLLVLPSRTLSPTSLLQAFFPLPSVFHSGRTRKPNSQTRQSIRFQISCISSKTSPQDLSEPCDYHIIPNISIPSCGMNRVKSAIAIVLIFIQISSPLPLAGWNLWYLSPATALLYSPDTKVPRTGELALRKAIPANTNMKAIQDSLEDISYLLRIPQRKPFGTMEGNVKKALKIAKYEKESILRSFPEDLREKGSTLYVSLLDGKGGLQSLLESVKDKDPDRVSTDLASTLDTVAEMELLQATNNGLLQYLVLVVMFPPFWVLVGVGSISIYMAYKVDHILQSPNAGSRLTGRGTVEFTIEKGDGSNFSPVAGEPKNVATIQVVIDGYSAPLTSGSFAKLVIDGAYDGTKLNCTDQAILSDSGLDKSSSYSVPLEIMPAGQFEPLYKTKLSVQDGELPVLPLSVYGAVSMAHSEDSEEYSSPSQFFFYLYDKRNAGLGGLSFDEGQFSVFGYTTVGREVLSQIKTGDLIRSAKLIEGQDHLILPNE